MRELTFSHPAVAPPVGAFVVSVVLVYASRLSMSMRSFMGFFVHSSGLLSQTNAPIPPKRTGTSVQQGETTPKKMRELTFSHPAVAPPVGAFVVSVVLVYASRLSMSMRSFMGFFVHSSGLLSQTNAPIPPKRTGTSVQQGETTPKKMRELTFSHPAVAPPVGLEPTT